MIKRRQGVATATKKAAAKPASSAKKPAAKATPVAKKPAAKPAAKAKPAKAVAAKKVVAKPAAKAPVKKPIAKPVAKAAAKPAVKKAPAKPVSAPAKKAPTKASAAKAVPAARKAAPKPVVAPPKKTAAKPVAPAPAAKKTVQPMPATTKTSKPAPQKAAPAAAAKKPAAKPAKRATGAVLSEAAILKMSEKDYMNDAQLEFFRAKLQGMKDEILENARETGEHLKENEVFADPNDRATVEEENMLEQRVRDRERKLLKKIDSALRRIEAGEYGYCLETGEPIGVGRLIARPTAELSIEAQEKHERLEKLFAD
jgi:DnaK suppressor protein